MNLFPDSETNSLSPYRKFVNRHAIEVIPIHNGTWEFSGEHQTLQTKVESKFMARAKDGTEVTADTEKEAVFKLAQKLKLEGMEKISWR